MYKVAVHPSTVRRLEFTLSNSRLVTPNQSDPECYVLPNFWSIFQLLLFLDLSFDKPVDKKRTPIISTTVVERFTLGKTTTR